MCGGNYGSTVDMYVLIALRPKAKEIRVFKREAKVYIDVFCIVTSTLKTQPLRTMETFCF